MDEYLKHIIFHLNKYGNAYFPANRRKEYGEFAVIKALREKGYDCDIRHFPDALVDPARMRTTKTDAVIILKGKIRRCSRR